jgi:hypothetical protein
MEKNPTGQAQPVKTSPAFYKGTQLIVNLGLDSNFAVWL